MVRCYYWKMRFFKILPYLHTDLLNQPIALNEVCQGHFDPRFKNSGSKGLCRTHHRAELLQVLRMVLEGCL